MNIELDEALTNLQQLDKITEIRNGEETIDLLKNAWEHATNIVFLYGKPPEKRTGIRNDTAPIPYKYNGTDVWFRLTGNNSLVDSSINSSSVVICSMANNTVEEPYLILTERGISTAGGTVLENPTQIKMVETILTHIENGCALNGYFEEAIHFFGKIRKTSSKHTSPEEKPVQNIHDVWKNACNVLDTMANGFTTKMVRFDIPKQPPLFVWLENVPSSIVSNLRGDVYCFVRIGDTSIPPTDEKVLFSLEPDDANWLKRSITAEAQLKPIELIINAIQEKLVEA